MDDPNPTIFIAGGLFLEPTVPNSLLNSVVSFKKNSPSSAVVSGSGLERYIQKLRSGNRFRFHSVIKKPDLISLGFTEKRRRTFQVRLLRNLNISAIVSIGDPLDFVFITVQL